MNYLTRFYHEAKNKLTTYVALTTAGLSEILGNWDQAAALFPPWLKAHKQDVVAASALLLIWTRVRRNLQSPPQ